MTSNSGALSCAVTLVKHDGLKHKELNVIQSLTMNTRAAPVLNTTLTDDLEVY